MDDLDVLLVEDNHGDVRLIEEAFAERALPGSVHAVRTVDAALDWLHGRGEFVDAPGPDLLLLDLNLPTSSGHVVLEELASEPRLQRLPVVVLTGTRSDADLLESYEAGANACVRKPVDPSVFADRLQALAEFWTTATLPPVADSSDAQ